MSGPSATVNPRSAKIAVTSSFTWLTGCTVPRGASGGGQRDVHALGGEPRVERTLFSSSVLLRRDGIRDAIAQRVERRAAWFALVGAHRAQRLEQLGDRALLAESGDAHIFERALVRGLCHRREQIAFELG